MTKSSDALASFDHDTSCWRTCQGSLLATLDASSDVFSGPWPRSGTMRNGVCYPRPTLARHTSESGSGSWPTPSANQFDIADVELMLERRERVKAQGMNGNGFGLTTAQAASAWATPTVDDANNVTRTSGAMQSLARDTTMWSTPAARDHRDTGNLATSMTRKDGTSRVQSGMVARDVFSWLNGNGSMPSQSEAPTTPSGSSPAKLRRAGLNPRFGLWLMGYPAAWLDSVESATASSRSARSKSSAPSKGDK